MKFKELREKYRSKYPSALVSAAVKIAIDMSGNMTGAYKKIEAMKKGLANDPMVKDALRQANESVKEETVKLVDMDDDSHQTALKLAQKAGVKVVSKKTKTGTELSVSGSNQKIGKFMMSLPESAQIGTVKEGTWAIPSTKEKMYKFQDMLQKPMFAKNKGEVEKFKNTIYSLMGDDELFDVYDRIIMDKEFNGQDMVELLVKNLEGRWFNFKKKGKGWVATHQYFEMEPEDDVEEGKGRPTGHYKPKRKIKVDLSAGKNY